MKKISPLIAVLVAASSTVNAKEKKRVKKSKDGAFVISGGYSSHKLNLGNLGNKLKDVSIDSKSAGFGYEHYIKLYSKKENSWYDLPRSRVVIGAELEFGSNLSNLVNVNSMGFNIKAAYQVKPEEVFFGPTARIGISRNEIDGITKEGVSIGGDTYSIPVEVGFRVDPCKWLSLEMYGGLKFDSFNDSGVVYISRNQRGTKKFNNLTPSLGARVNFKIPINLPRFRRY